MKKEQKHKPRLTVDIDLKKTDKFHFVSSLPNVFFPYEPYSQQLDIVSAIQKSIANNQNALI